MAWVRPTSYSDPNSRWTDETKAYDSDTTTFAYSAIHSSGYWTDYIYFYRASAKCYQVRFICNAYTHDYYPSGASIDISVEINSNWVSVYSGSYTYNTYVTKNFTANNVTGIRIRFYNNTGVDVNHRIRDLQLNTVDAPTVTTNACSDILGYSVKGNGSITSVNGENATERGFCYLEGASGDPTTSNNKVFDLGTYGTGSFSKTISGLASGTTYRVRAYAINGAGTGYGATVSVTTAKSPTVITNAVTSITYNSATFNGNITDDDGKTIIERGFEYKEGESGEVFKVYDIGDYGTGTFNKTIDNLEPNTLYYVRAYAKNSAGIGYGDWVTFTTDKTTPTVVTNEATEVDKDKFKANGNITATGGENCTVRGFQYGLTPIATWDTHDEGSYEAGAFNKVITGLQANTIYYFRAYATNSEGTSYGDWLQVTTASAGTTPSGTKISLVGDYSGYINQLHASEQDLGAPYKGYFVLTTDFAEGQSLAVYKRLLYLVNYFRKETSGEVKISVKCDNETNWREMGTVELTGDEDILMQEMGVDELAKSFLIKVESENAFRYLGTIFWYLVQGVR